MLSKSSILIQQIFQICMLCIFRTPNQSRRKIEDFSRSQNDSSVDRRKSIEIYKFRCLRTSFVTAKNLRFFACLQNFQFCGRETEFLMQQKRSFCMFQFSRLKIPQNSKNFDSVVFVSYVLYGSQNL